MTVCCAATRYPPTAPSPGSSPPRIAVTSPPTDDELTDDAATWVVTAPHSAGYAVRVLNSGDARRYRDTARGVHVWHLWDEATGCPAQRGAIVAATQPAALDFGASATARELEQEVADLDALVQRQGALLLATADALKGPPPPLSQHSAHDLPEVAAALAARVRELEAQVAAARSASTVNADRAQVDALAGARFAAEHPDAAGRIVG